MKLTQDFVNAAQYVLDQHLSKPYDDKDAYPNQDPFRDGGRERGFKRPFIDRPIHGFVHTMRTVAYAPVLLECYKESKLKDFDKIDETELQKIAIAQLFFVAGRRSEQSFTKYKEYHRLGAQYFSDYARAHLQHLFSEAEIIKYAGIIEDAEPIYKKLPEARIIGLAHGVDLLRTRTDSQVFHKVTEAEREDARRNQRRAPLDGIAVTLRERFGDKNGMAICEYAWNLFKETGDSCQPFNVAPGEESTVGEKWPLTAPTFKKQVLEVRQIFEESQYSVNACLTNIIKVKPPKGEVLDTPLSEATANKSPSKRRKLSEPPELPILKAQEKKLNEEINGLRMLEERPGELDQIITPLVEELKIVLTKISEIKVPDAKPEPVYNWLAQDYHVMVQKEIDLNDHERDVVKIPSDGNCCFNAVLVAAKDGGFLPRNITNHYELRQAAIRYMRDRHIEELRIFKLGNSDIEPQKTSFRLAQQSLQVTYPREIKDYNKQFGTSINNMENYLSHMEKLDTWGGTLELAAMAELLNINIINHSINAPSAVKLGDKHNVREIHLQHTGHHYNFYVAPDSWHLLPNEDPVIQFQNQIAEVRRENLERTYAQVKNVNKELNFDGGNSYINYMKCSHQFNSLELRMQFCLDELKKKNLAPETEKQMGYELQQISLERTEVEKKLNGLRVKFRTLPDFEEKLNKQYFTLAIRYEELIEQLKLCADDVKVKNEIISTLHQVENEIGFIFRESGERDKYFAEMAKHQSRRLGVQRRLNKIIPPKEGPIVLTDTVSSVHLRRYLGERYSPLISLEDNIKLFFQDPDVRVMLHQGGPIGGIDRLEDPDARWVYRPVNERDYVTPGIYDQEIIDHYVQQLKRMVEAESQYPDSYPLYNAMGANLCIGNDVIRELSSLLNYKDYGPLFRLFSDDFNYENAEDFRKDVYDTKKLMDDGPEFHKRGLACAISPFQALQEESALDFWSHNRNVQSFDRWKLEILPKLQEISKDPLTLADLQKDYNELTQLNNQLGARMNQFLLSKEDLDKYSWLSGAFGFKTAAVKEGGTQADKISDALDYYKASPEDFIPQTAEARKKFFSENKERHFVDNKGKVYDINQDSPIARERHLDQLQARLYLHPDLFEPGRMQVRTYYSGMPDPRLVEEYNLKVRNFSERLCGLILKAKAEDRLTGDAVPEDLTATFIPFRFLRNAPLKKHEAAQQKLHELIDLGIIIIPSEIHGSKIFMDIHRLIHKNKGAVDQIVAEFNKESLSSEARMNQLSECFYYAIINGDVPTFEALMQFYRSRDYDFNQYPVDFDKLSNGQNIASAMVLASKANKSEMISHLVNIRNDSGWGAWLGDKITGKQPIINIRRTATEDATKNQPLHYLAQHGNVDAFKLFAESMVKNWNLPSIFYSQGTMVNANNNTPLHILALNEADLLDQRMDILRYLMDENTSAFKTLFGDAAIITQNDMGVSPIMMAALSQNEQAIRLFAEKLKLSENQTLIYLWLAQNPAQRLPLLLNEIDNYGRIPGFVPKGWEIPEEIIKNILAENEPVMRPPRKTNELKTILEKALIIESNKVAISKAYDELLVAMGNDEATSYIDKLKNGSIGKEAVSIKNLAELVKDKKIVTSVIRTTEDTPLIAAAKSGNMSVVIALCDEKDALKIERTAKDSLGNTALHYLVNQDNSDQAIVALLRPTSWTTDPTRVQDNNGNNPFHLIAALGKNSTLKAIDGEFTTKTWYWGNCSGVYNKFGYQPTTAAITGTVVGAIVEVPYLIPAAFAQNKAGLTPIMIAVLQHPENKVLINYFCNAMSLSAQDQHLYIDLAAAINSNDKDRVAVGIKNIIKISGWNAAAGAAQLSEVLKLCDLPRRGPAVGF